MLKIKIENFEGPLDLLLHLIEKNKMQITDIKISIIADEYLALIDELEDEKMNELSEFVEMAAILLSIKSSYLLPKHYEEEVNPEEELIERLIEYKKFKLISEQMEEINYLERYTFKEPTIPNEVLKAERKVDITEIVKDHRFDELFIAFNNIIKRSANRIDQVRSKFSDITRQVYVLEDIKEQLLELRSKTRTVSFYSLVEKMTSKLELIVTFLAVLELIKEGYISVRQTYLHDDIEINFLEDSDN